VSVNITFVTYKTGEMNISLKYVLGLLNSRLYYYWLYYNGKRAGNRLMLDPTPIMNIPIKCPPTNLQTPFIVLVDKILAITKPGDYLENPVKKGKVKEYEKQIDQMVYRLYELTPEEIRIVEESTNKVLTAN
jgi:hypothetical protein